MKLNGPIRAWKDGCGGWWLLDMGKKTNRTLTKIQATGENGRDASPGLCRRIAAALNAYEAEESRRRAVKAADERLIEALKKTPDSATVALLTKRRTARGGAK